MKSKIVSDRVFSLCLIGAILISLISVNDVFAELTISDRIKIDNDDTSLDIADGDLFGYVIENIGDLDGDGIIDLATIKFEDDSGETDAGSILILFMNADGSVKSTNEITQDTTASGIGSSCIAGDSTNRDNRTLEQLAFVGDLDGDNKPTLAVGAPSNDYGATDTGAVYMLELNSDGTVDNCFLIIPNNPTHTSGFAPDSNLYIETPGSAFFGWPLIAIDLGENGQKELLVGASSEDGKFTNLWPLVLNSTGGVLMTAGQPILGNATIGMDADDYIDDAIVINDRKFVVSAKKGGTGEGSIFIITLEGSSGVTVSSSTEITGLSLNQGINSDDNFGRGLAALGDMDADGIEDILVGNISGDDGGTNSGEVYILFLNSDDSLKGSQKISNESTINGSVSTFLSPGDFFGNGMTIWKNDGTTAIIAIGAHADDTGESKAGAIHLLYIERVVDAIIIKRGGSSGDTTPSTLGISNGVRMVENGFSFNGKSVNVDNYHTEFPLISVLVGFPNTVEMKIYENGGLSKINRVQFGLGVKEVGTPLSESEVIVLINLHHNGTSVESIEYEGDETLLVVSKTKVVLSIVKCKTNSSSECLLVSLTYTYREGPRYDMLVVNTMDDRRNTWNYYFNDGVKVIGSMNSAPTHTIFVRNGNQDPGEHVTLTRIDKINDIWKDIHDIEYQNNNGAFDRITPYKPWTCNDPPIEELNVPTRLNCNFRALTTIWG